MVFLLRTERYHDRIKCYKTSIISGEDDPLSQYESEIKRRRTFAIISHPDAGKTTLTEKFLLYGGAIAQAAPQQACRLPGGPGLI